MAWFFFLGFRVVSRRLWGQGWLNPRSREERVPGLACSCRCPTSRRRSATRRPSSSSPFLGALPRRVCYWRGAAEPATIPTAGAGAGGRARDDRGAGAAGRGAVPLSPRARLPAICVGCSYGARAAARVILVESNVVWEGGLRQNNVIVLSSAAIYSTSASRAIP